MAEELKPRQEKFCQNYLLYRNATRAAIEAGYSEASAHNQGYRLLKEPAIQERITELEGGIVTNIDVIAELEKQYEVAKNSGHGQTALKALELLARARGNNQEDTGPVDVESLEQDIIKSFQIIGKDKVYELLISCFPEDFENEELTDEE